MTKKLNTTFELDEIIKSQRVFSKNGKLHVDYRINTKYIFDGKERIRFSTGVLDTTRNKQRMESEALTLSVNHYLKSNDLKNPNEIYLRDIALEALNEDRDNRAEDTHDDYVKIYEKYIEPVFANKLVTDIKTRDIKAWKNNLLNEKHLSKSRFTKYYRTLNFIIKYAYVNEYIDKNPMELVDKRSKSLKQPNTNLAMKYYSKDEVKLIIENAQGWFKIYLITLFYSGMRVGECLALKWSDLDLTNNTITIQRSVRHGNIRNTTKTGVTNIIDMAEPVKENLIKYYDVAPSDEWIFPNPQTLLPYWSSKSIIKSQFKPLLNRLNIEYKTLYATRHSFASIMVENNVPLTYIQKQLSHKKLSTTLDYYVKNSFVNQKGRDVRIDCLYK